MAEADRTYQFEVYERHQWEDVFIGNAFIATYADGTTKMVTAKHVAYKGFQPRELVLVPIDQGGDQPEITGLVFRRRKDSDIAEADLSGACGLAVSEVADVESPLTISGSTRGGLRHNIKVIATYICGKHRNEIQEPQEFPLTGTVIHYTGASPDEQTFPGTSGSPIQDSKNNVIGVHTTRRTHTSDGKYHGIGDLLRGKRQYYDE